MCVGWNVVPVRLSLAKRGHGSGCMHRNVARQRRDSTRMHVLVSNNKLLIPYTGQKQHSTADRQGVVT